MAPLKISFPHKVFRKQVELMLYYISEYETKQKLACHSVAVRPPATASAASKNLFACLLYSPPTPAQVFVPWRNDVSEPFVEAGLSLLARVSSIDLRDFRDLD